MNQAITPIGDLGTPELHKRQTVVMAGEGRTAKARVLNHPLDLYFEKRFIESKHYYAAIRLFNDWSISHTNKTTLRPILSDSSSVSSDGAMMHPKEAFERYMRVYGALNSKGKILAGLVVIEGYTLASHEVRAAMGWNKKNTGMDRLKELCEDIADLYKMLIDTRPVNS